MYTDQTPNARYGRITVRISTALNRLLLIVICAGLWFFAARANSHGIPPNTTLGFRSQRTLASLHGWYVAQRVGFHFAAIAVTVVTAVVFAIIAVAYVRRVNPMWILIVPVIGWIAVAVCFMIAGHYADQAAISVETPKAESHISPDVGSRPTSFVFARISARPPVEAQSRTVDFTAHDADRTYSWSQGRPSGAVRLDYDWAAGQCLQAGNDAVSKVD